MAHETEPPEMERIPLTGIYVDIPGKSVILASAEGIVGSVRLAPEGVVFEAPRSPTLPATTSVAELPAEVASVQEQEGTPEREKPLTLQGKLKSRPRPGRPDARGNPTAWARFAAHEEDEEGAHMYSTTFHRQTVEIALGLEKDMPVTVQGFPHLQDDPSSTRMDTLSVINLLDYPGKPRK
jgi:hypothetical protein